MVVRDDIGTHVRIRVNGGEHSGRNLHRVRMYIVPGLTNLIVSFQLLPNHRWFVIVTLHEVFSRLVVLSIVYGRIVGVIVNPSGGRMDPPILKRASITDVCIRSFLGAVVYSRTNGRVVQNATNRSELVQRNKSNSPIRNALNYCLARDIQINNRLDTNLLVQCNSLLHRPRKPVQQQMPTAPNPIRRILHHEIDHHSIGNEIPAGHIFIGLSTEFGLFPYVLTEYVVG